MAAKRTARAKSSRRTKVMAQSVRAAARKSEAVQSEFLDGAIDWASKHAVTARKAFLAAPVLISVVTASIAAAVGWLVARR